MIFLVFVLLPVIMSLPAIIEDKQLIRGFRIDTKAPELSGANNIVEEIRKKVLEVFQEDNIFISFVDWILQVVSRHRESFSRTKERPEDLEMEHRSTD